MTASLQPYGAAPLPTHRAAPTRRPGAAGPSYVSHRAAPQLSPRTAAAINNEKREHNWDMEWATSTWANWQPLRPNAPPGARAPYEEHEAARNGTRLMPDQGSVITGLRAELAEYKRRDRRYESELRLKQELASLRASNQQLLAQRKDCSPQVAAELRKENEALRKENLYLNQRMVQSGLALVRAEKELDAVKTELEVARSSG